MPTATLSLEWASGVPNHEDGWCIRIFGMDSSASVDFTAHHFVGANTAPYKQFPPQAGVGSGPVGWMITPKQLSSFGMTYGARRQHHPMGCVTQYLQMMNLHGYKIVGTHSLSTGGEMNYCPLICWTLHK